LSGFSYNSKSQYFPFNIKFTRFQFAVAVAESCVVFYFLMKYFELQLNFASAWISMKIRFKWGIFHLCMSA
jgi:hypothetical protein